MIRIQPLTNILIIIGTRPEGIKLIPVYKAFKKIDQINVEVLATGQHAELVQQIFQFFGIIPDYNLLAGSKNQSLGGFSSSLLEKLDKFLEDRKFDWIVVQGDTTSCMISSLVAFYHRIKVAHIEAGLRTANKQSPYPEEVNRRLTSILADIHFAPTEQSRVNLNNEGINKDVLVVGNTVVDSLLLAKQMLDNDMSTYDKKYDSIITTHDRMILITGHRRENFGDGFENIFQAIISLSIKYPTTAFVYPVHFNPNVREHAHKMLAGINNVFLIDPVPYNEIIYLIDRSYLVMTDSGGLQEECPSLGKPVIVLRDTTERPEGIDAGCCVLAGTNQESIIRVFESIFNDADTYSKMSLIKNPYGDGQAAGRICEGILNFKD